MFLPIYFDFVMKTSSVAVSWKGASCNEDSGIKGILNLS